MSRAPQVGRCPERGGRGTVAGDVAVQRKTLCSRRSLLYASGLPFPHGVPRPVPHHSASQTASPSGGSPGLWPGEGAAAVQSPRCRSHAPAQSAAFPRWGACGLPLPGAEKGRPQAAQRSSECKRRKDAPHEPGTASRAVPRKGRTRGGRGRFCGVTQTTVYAAPHSQNRPNNAKNRPAVGRTVMFAGVVWGLRQRCRPQTSPTGRWAFAAGKRPEGESPAAVAPLRSGTPHRACGGRRTRRWRRTPRHRRSSGQSPRSPAPRR